jgi:hypothetical protein
VPETRNVDAVYDLLGKNIVCEATASNSVVSGSSKGRGRKRPRTWISSHKTFRDIQIKI